MLDEKQFLQELSAKINIPFKDLDALEVNTNASKYVSEQTAKNFGIVPIDVSDKEITVAMSDAMNTRAIEDIKISSGKRVSIVLATSQAINNMIKKAYTQSEKAEQALSDFKAEETVETGETISSSVDMAPIVRIVNSIFLDAINMGASDIHIEPFEKYLVVRIRIDGDLKELLRLPLSSLSGIITRIKIMSDLNIAENKRPQDGRIQMKVEGKQINMRVSIIPVIYGEKIVIRILSNDAGGLDKTQIGLSPENMARVEKIMKITEGVILLTGPTGSGKTTTLYALLKDYNKPNVNIITLEDPVEYRMEGVNQVQVNSQVGMTFASGLRSILRQDPNVIMLGEIRDEETAQIAIRAAVTGHIVLSTLHTNDTASSITRLIDMGVPRYMVSSAVSGIIAQRLLKKNCPRCTEEYDASGEEKQLLGIDPASELKLKRGKGCPYCNQTGYKGRTSIHEVLVLNQKIKNMVNNGTGIDEIKQTAIEGGMKTLTDSARELVLSGVTTVEQAMKTTYVLE